MKSNQDTQSGSVKAADKSQHLVKDGKNSIDPTSSQRPSILPRSSLESTATVTALPPYSQQSDRPPKYNDAGIYASLPSPSGENKTQAKRVSQPFSAASINAVMATSSSSNDRMHSRQLSSRKVENWNEDPSYKAKLSSIGESTRKWNYFGADIGENPFRRKKK